MKPSPALPDVGVLAIVPESFDEPWQSRQQILTRLSLYFQVVWVEPAPEWRDTFPWRRRKRVREQFDDQTNAFVVDTPLIWLLKLSRPASVGRLLDRIRLMRARRVLLDRGCQTTVLSLWRPAFEPALSMVPHDLAVYHIDDEYVFSGVETAPDERELRLIDTVDLVSVHSRGLMRRKGGINPRTVFIPNGVDYPAYAASAPEPVDLAAIPHPRIGYAGYLKLQLDWSLLRALIVSHPNWHFVFVGPRRPHEGLDSIVRALAREPNAHFLPAKGLTDLRAYPQHFDVCIMPYETDEYTKCIYPLKLHEYLASGRPVVGTPIPTSEEFADVIALARTADEWSAAIAAALDPAAATDARRAARQMVAKEHDWSSIAQRTARAIASALGPGVLDRLEATLQQPTPLWRDGRR